VIAGVAFDAVLFDFRGTLFNVEDDPTWVRNAALSIGRALTDEEVTETCRRLDETLAARPDLAEGLERCDTSLDVHRGALLAWFEATGLDRELAHAIWARDSDDPAANYPYPDTEPVMRALHESGTRVAVVSDIHYDIRDHFVRHQLDAFVDAYVLSYRHGIQKPDAEMFIRALEAVDVPPERALMVGDRASHDGGAAECGIASYIFPGPFQGGTRAPRGLDAVLRLVGVPKP
jgi:HAD superfamily hydrolase (TIGR01549 family)